MNIAKVYKENIFNFDTDGVMSLSDYWGFLLMGFIVNIFICWIPFVNIVWYLITFLPYIFAQLRRLRDAGYSGYSLLWWLLPFVGWAVLIVLLLQPAKKRRQKSSIAKRKNQL
jgi:uncharacterized membrane protein YhaH (DUF805 family)